MEVDSSMRLAAVRALPLAALDPIDAADAVSTPLIRATDWWRNASPRFPPDFHPLVPFLLAANCLFLVPSERLEELMSKSGDF